MTILLETTLSYLPENSKAVYSLVSNEVYENVTCAFVLGFYEGKLMLANNLKRGIEIPGGHIEEDETPKMASIREFLEEVGGNLSYISPFIRLDIICSDQQPIKNYKYPYPRSIMEFFYGEVSDIGNDIITSEVAQPSFINIDNLLDNSHDFVKKYQDDQSFRLIIDQAILYYRTRNRDQI